MSYHFGVRFSLLSFILGGYLSVSSIDVKDLTQSKCRIAGVVLVENQDRSQKFNYTMAESACQDLGLQLASKAQVEKAKGYGYETCSYGWVSEQVGVIPRIQNNENCGRNKTGVLTWKVDLNKMFFSAYCFNASDIQINSCKPGLMVTQPPSSSAAVPTSGSTMASTSAKTETQMEPRETSTPPVWTTWKASTTSLHTTLVTTVKPARSTTALQTTPTPDTIPPTKQENQMAQKSERVVFGGLPTTLLVLALLFFIAAVVLAICYIKKYKTHLLFTKKKKEKELVEAKVFKDTSGAENTKEQYTNGKDAECLQNPTGNSIEAEV